MHLADPALGEKTRSELLLAFQNLTCDFLTSYPEHDSSYKHASSSPFVLSPISHKNFSHFLTSFCFI